MTIDINNLSFTDILRFVDSLNEKEKSNLEFAAKETISFMKNSNKYHANVKWQKMYDDWYVSLMNNNPDYSVYDRMDYLVELWCCFKVYSKDYIKRIVRSKEVFPLIQNAKKIVDLGCGIGATTALLKDKFPNAQIIGTNIPNTVQSEVCTKLSEAYNFEVDYNRKKIPEVDIIFASEYFEHFEKPIIELLSVLNRYMPKYLFIANAFNANAIGHFDFYYHDRRKYPCKEMPRIFSQYLKKYGYVKVKTKFWNQRPQFWVRK